MIYGYLVILIFIFECIAKKIRCNLIKKLSNCHTLLLVIKSEFPHQSTLCMKHETGGLKHTKNLF